MWVDEDREGVWWERCAALRVGEGLKGIRRRRDSGSAVGEVKVKV
jgi:hypothetical protein